MSATAESPPIRGGMDGGTVVKPESGARMRQAAAVTLALFATYLFALSPAVAAVPRCFGLKATIVGTRFGERLAGTDERDVIVGVGGATGSTVAAVTT